MTGVIFHNVRHEGWLHSKKNDYTPRVIARTFHVMCMNFHNGWLHVHPQLATTLGVTLWKITHVTWKVRATTLFHRPPSMWELIRSNTRHTEIACDYHYRLKVNSFIHNLEEHFYGCPIVKITCQLPVWGLSKIDQLPANFLYQGNKTKKGFVFIFSCNVVHHGYSQANSGNKQFPSDLHFDTASWSKLPCTLT